MRLLRCSLSALLAFVLLLGLFSGSCYASTTVWDKPPEEDLPTVFASSDGNSSTYSTRYRNFWRNPSGSYDSMNLTTPYTQPPPAASLEELDLYSIHPISNYNTTKWYNYSMCDEYTMVKNDGSIMAKKNQSLSVQFSYLYGMFQGNDSSNTLVRQSYFDASKIDRVLVFLMYPDGSQSFVEDCDYEIFNVSMVGGVITPSSTPTGNYSLNLNINNIPKEIIGFNVEIQYIPSHAYDNTSNGHNGSFSDCYSSYMYVGYCYRSEFSLYLTEPTDGLLSGILDFVKNIKEGVTDTVSAITELPSKIWLFIENGLKNLFVPSETDMTSIKEDWDNLLRDRFGGLYQSVQLIDDYASTFTNTGTTNSIKVPELSVDLVGSTFSFGGQDVQIIPNKFSFLIDVIKTIISIIATVFFVNGLRNRFTREVIEGGNEQ